MTTGIERAEILSLLQSIVLEFDSASCNLPQLERGVRPKYRPFTSLTTRTRPSSRRETNCRLRLLRTVQPTFNTLPSRDYSTSRGSFEFFASSRPIAAVSYCKVTP